MNDTSVPRVPLGFTPTPLMALDRLSETLGGPRIWMKRDDCTGLATGGNKTRKLEFLLGQAEADEAGTVITFGALQSNHARQTAAACALRGLACELILTDPVGRAEDDYSRSGNLLLDDLLGATVHRCAGEKPVDVMKRIIAAHEAEGRRVAVIPTGGSNAIGALGYVECMREIAEQTAQSGCPAATIIHASSTGGTQAGLLAGAQARGVSTRVIGVNTYTANDDELRERVATLAAGALERIAPDATLPTSAIEVLGGVIGDGYGVPTPAMVEAVRLVARTEGVLLDPVYTGKAMAGLVSLVRKGQLDSGDVVFVHTGGSHALSVYAGAFGV